MENIGSYIEIGFTVLGIVVTACSAIVLATPSVKDDAIWAKVIKVVDFVSVFNPKKPKAP
jgi:hypothetical protein